MFKKLKSIFIVEDEAFVKNEAAEKEKTSASPQQKVKADVTSKASTTSQSSVKPNPNAKPSAKFVDVLLKSIEENNLEGFDYLEYKQSLQSLSKMGMDDQTRYQSAFAMAKTMGATSGNLLKAAKHYINVLDKEKAKFDEAFKQRKVSEVSDRQNRLKGLKESIVNKEKEIKKLQAEIENHKKELDKFNNQIAKSENKLQATSDGFLAAYGSVKNQIVADMDNMKKYLS